MAAYTDSRSARKEERKLLPVWYRVLSLVLTIAAIGVAVFAFGTVLVSRASEDGSNLFGYVVLTVESGSMSPALEEGDVIAGRAYDGGELVVGDIVTFRAPSGVFKGRYITHRIAEVGEEDGVAVYRTKGDAANSVDSWTLKGEDIVAVYEKKLPTVKKVAEFMSGAGGRMLMIGLPVILLVGVFVADSVVSRRLATKIKAEREAARLEFDGQFSADGKTLVKEGMRAKFLKHLAEKHAKELKENLGLDDGQISQMAERGRVPNGFNVHHKLPLHVGGKNEFSNFILIPLYPHDQLHRDILDKQIENMKEGERRTILLPACEDMVYDPKKYGYMKNNQKVEPNYESRVDVAKYSDNYLPEHIAEIRSKREKTEKPKVISLFKTLKEISESGKAAALLPERVAAVPPPPPAVQKKISEKGRG